jgi:energy-converting hydrogenase Eha subunit G
MNEKTKYLAILILAVIVSSATSYAATLSLPTGTVKAADVEALVEQQVAEQLSPSKVTLPYEVSFFAAGNSIVTVYSKMFLENLTIVYKYTCLENGTTVTRSIDYGAFIPAWGAGAVIEAGAVPQGLYKMPDVIITACSTTYVNSVGCTQFDIQPKCEILEVYGYS